MAQEHQQAEGVVRPAVESQAGLGQQLATEWTRIRSRLQREVGDVEFRSWLRNMSLVGIDGDEVTIHLPSGFMRD
ncbi:MAG: DnaA N-terminal domain-containing protein, partial [Janthinobacterium lividum]